VDLLLNNNKDLKKTIYYRYILFAAGILVYCCAKVGSPSGGPKDEDPPEIVNSNPENYSSDFRNKKIEITFDEFIQLKNIRQELITSPPLEDMPVTKLKGKNLIIELENELRENTTYTLYFGNSIVDNNEGNPIQNFEFVFSTGSHVDTLSVTGKLVNAFNLQTEEDPVYIMLHNNLNDSAPYLEIPAFIGKTRKDGTFELNNIRPDTFRIFALKDANSNLLFDQNSENIAFIDSSFILDPKLIETENFYLADSLIPPDSIVADSLLPEFVVDTITGDTIMLEKKIRYALHVNLFLFEEENIFQYLTARERETREKIMFAFKHPLYDSLVINPLNFKYYDDWFIEEKSADNDTVICWIRDSAITKMDTISLQLSYTIVDSSRNFVIQVDTIHLRYRKPKATSKPGKKKNKAEQVIEKNSKYLDLELNIRKDSKLDLNRSVIINTGTPVLIDNDSLISLYKREDTLEIIQKFALSKDTGTLRKYRIISQWEEGARYKLLIEPGAFTDIYGVSNDSVLIEFSMQSIDYYGNIMLSVENVSSPVIIQLLDEKEKILREKFTSVSGSTVFDFLNPKKYKLKVVYDNNNNRKWDTGNYLKKIQPEKVAYYKGEVNVRSNWDVEITLNIE
jgi:hypothetical protein